MAKNGEDILPIITGGGAESVIKDGPVDSTKV